jgi:hypothetical protein
MVFWNLVDSLTITGSRRRAFYMPVASLPPGRTTLRTTLPDQFLLSDDRTSSGDPALTIRISSNGGFNDEGDLPDPALRLHAMGPGKISFKPAAGDRGNQLILTMLMFTLIRSSQVPWWGRWEDAGCWPEKIFYENVDRSYLNALLHNLRPSTPNNDGSFYGLRLPPEVTTLSERDSFINDFLAGRETHFLIAVSGAVIGKASTESATSSDPNSTHLLRLHARYRGHTNANLRPLNPLEFFYLLFGNTSSESTTHPLLQKINQTGMSQPGHESKTMRLRPPLRTHARLMWEADIEISNSNAHHWAYTLQTHPNPDPPGTANCSSRFYNRLRRNNKNFDYMYSYVGSFKCNLFISDVALRSGFRCLIHDVGSTFHYCSAGEYTNRVHQTRFAHDREPLIGRIPSNGRHKWGLKIERWIRSVPEANRQNLLNRAMHEEGRCFILGGYRDPNPAPRPGHIVIVVRVHGQPEFLPQNTTGPGLKSISITTKEARGQSAGSRVNQTFSLQGTGGAADSTGNFSKLHLFELHPGQDPDITGGLSDCNVEV